MAPVVRRLQANDQTDVTVCVTGQHREMLDQVLELFGIQPDVDLDLMQANQSLNGLTARVLLALDPVLADLQPDWLLVQGDTTTVMAAALAAHNRRIKVGHVEAGLRTYDRANPFPEEMNRVVADHVSDLHFAPTGRSRDALLREAISPDSVFVTGNTVIDALLWAGEQPLPQEALTRLADAGYQDGKETILVTAHRRENHGQPIRDICAALARLARDRPERQIVYPVHRNPNIEGPVHELLAGRPGIVLLPPVDYLTLAYLMQNSRLILTDSGGIQEEAPSLGKPVLVLREATERPEAVDAGAVRLVGTDADQIVRQAESLLSDSDAYAAMARAVNPYGDGRAAQRIVDVLVTGKCEEF
jgi:UDP-N-acetylglucosamine 2-epimerase